MVEVGYEYDVVDRVTRRTIYDGTTEIESTRTDYFVAQANAVTTTPYDIEDNPVFISDDKMAPVSAYDSAHRARQTLTSDGGEGSNEDASID